jgi:hypothetical protein
MFVYERRLTAYFFTALAQMVRAQWARKLREYLYNISKMVVDSGQNSGFENWPNFPRFFGAPFT